MGRALAPSAPRESGIHPGVGVATNVCPGAGGKDGARRAPAREEVPSAPRGGLRGQLRSRRGARDKHVEEGLGAPRWALGARAVEAVRRAVG